MQKKTFKALLILSGLLISGCNFQQKTSSLQPSTPSVTSSEKVSSTSSIDESKTSITVVPTTSKSTNSSAITNVLMITKQPQSVKVNYPNSVSFSVEVNNEKLVKSYCWEAGGYNGYGEAISFTPIPGTIGNKATLTIPGISRSPTKSPFRCCITDIEGHEIYSDVASYTVMNPDEVIPVAYVLDYPIIPGNSLNLEDTPYGTGYIYFNSEATKLTFYNVNFNNSVIASDLQNIAFSFAVYNSPVEILTVNFIGTNVINNTYWENDYNQGGFGMYFDFAGPNSKTKELIFTGDGSLNIYGGTRAISTNVKFTLDVDTTITGSPRRLTKGINAQGIEITRNTVLTGNVGGSFLFSENSDDFPETDVVINEGAIVDCFMNVGSVSMGATQVYGICASRDIIINSAQVNFEFVVDATYMLSHYYCANPIDGLYAANEVKINNSKVNIEANTFNEPSRDEYPDTSYLVGAGVNGISCFKTTINNSEVNICLKSQWFAQVFGIQSGTISMLYDKVYVEIESCDGACGVVAPFNDKTNGIVTIEDTELYIKLTNLYINPAKVDVRFDCGIRGKQVNLDTSENGHIVVETNGAPVMLVTFAKSEEKIEPKPVQKDDDCERRYVPSFLDFDNKFNISTRVPYEFNQNCYNNGGNVFVHYETIYERSETDFCKNFLTFIDLTELKK